MPQMCPTRSAQARSVSPSLASAGSQAYQGGLGRDCRLLVASAISLPLSPNRLRCSCSILFGCSFRKPLRSAKIQIRSRLCGAPTSQAPSTPHLASYPIAAKSPRTRPSPREVSIGEFSTKTKRGRTSQMTRAISTHIPERSPSIPAPFPALLMSRQGHYGNPPQMASSSDTPFHAANASAHSGLSDLSVRMSSQIGNSGKIPSRCLCSKTSLGYRSISQAAIGVCPSSRSAKIPPPAPEKRWIVLSAMPLFFVFVAPTRRIRPLPHATGCRQFYSALA